MCVQDAEIFTKSENIWNIIEKRAYNNIDNKK